MRGVHWQRNPRIGSAFSPILWSVFAYAATALTVPCEAIAAEASPTESPSPPASQIAAGAASGQAGDGRPAAWNLHGQFTFVEQGHGRFTSPYEGDNSLTSARASKETADLTLFAGVRLWRGAALYVNPEIDQGFGLDNTLGMAGFPSGEAYKVGQSKPYLKLPRAFLRQRIDLGCDSHDISPGANELGGTLAADNVTVTIGKFSVVDLFDTNRYAHDPRADFLNWSIIDAGAFDYAADAWGYTIGAAAEWTQSWWTIRGGVFELSDVPNSTRLEPSFREYSLIGEVEGRYMWQGHPGKLKLLGFVNRGRMARYDDAVRQGLATGSAPDPSSVRRFASRPGASLNLEQELDDSLGAFARISVNDGSKEAYEFTDVNRSLSLGLLLKGGGWGRPEDSIGLAAAINDISAAARAYFAAGGLGILVGDGRLSHPGREKIVETFYSMQLSGHASVSADYQYAMNPAYNRDRGPVSIFALRAHVEF